MLKRYPQLLFLVPFCVKRGISNCISKGIPNSLFNNWEPPFDLSGNYTSKSDLNSFLNDKTIPLKSRNPCL